MVKVVGIAMSVSQLLNELVNQSKCIYTLHVLPVTVWSVMRKH